MDDLGNGPDPNAPTSASNYDPDAAYNEDSQYIADNGGPGNPYYLNQSPQDQADTGSVTVTPAGTPTVATTSPPSWFSSLISSVNTTAQTIQTTANVVNGKPGQPAAGPGPTKASAIAGGTSNKTLLIVGAVVVAILAFVFLGKKRR